MSYVHQPGCPSPTLCDCYPMPSEFVTMWRVAYKAKPEHTDRAVHTLYFDTQAEAEADAAELNSRTPWRDAVAESHTFRQPREYQAPFCSRCGTTKVSDLFKGEHCPRCNDWV